MSYIIGQPVEDNDNDPVEVRGYELIYSGQSLPIGTPQTPIYTDGYQTFWRYYDNGIIASSQNSCAMVVYGEIFSYYDSVNQFNGHLGFPTTDVTTLPDGSQYAVFEHGVLYLGSSGSTVVEERALSPGLVKGFSGLDPTISGITQVAQQKINAFAQNALQTSQQLRDNVSSITPSVVFESVASGGCTGASFNSPGTSLIPGHTFRVHFDFGLSGCAGAFGSASADLHVTVRLFVGAGNVTALLQSFTIDSVGSPFGVADNDIRSNLTDQLNAQYGTDLLDASLPSNVRVLGVVVSQANDADVQRGGANVGDVKIYIAPFCSVMNLMRQDTSSQATSRLRQIRDHLLASTRDPDTTKNLLTFYGAAFTALILQQHDRHQLFREAARLLQSAAIEDIESLEHQADRLLHTIEQAEVQARSSPGRSRKLLERAVARLRSAVNEQDSLSDTLRKAEAIFEQ